MIGKKDQIRTTHLNINLRIDMSAFTYRVGVALRQKFGGFAHPEKIRNAYD